MKVMGPSLAHQETVLGYFSYTPDPDCKFMPDPLTDPIILVSTRFDKSALRKTYQKCIYSVSCGSNFMFLGFN